MQNDWPDLSQYGETGKYLRQVYEIMYELSPGLVITLRGVSTPVLDVNGQPTVLLLDFVRHKLRLGNESWSLRQHPPAQLFYEVQNWLTAQGSDITLGKPNFEPGLQLYDSDKADEYAHDLWRITRS